MQSTPNLTVRFTAVLQKHVNGNKEIEVQGNNISELLDDLEGRFPGFLRQLMNDEGELHQFVNIYLNDEDIRYIGGIDTAVKDGDMIDILPALAGGG